MNVQKKAEERNVVSPATNTYLQFYIITDVY
jgi:hypothetical protein